MDDVRGVQRVQRRGAFGVGEVAVGDAVRRRGVDQHPRYRPGQAGGEGGGGEQQRRGAVAQQVGDPLRGVAGVDRQVGGAGLEDREHGGDQVGGARQGQRHPLLGADAPGDQQAGQPVGAGVQFGVAELALLADQGDGVGLLGGPLLEQRGPGGVGAGPAGVVPGVEQPVPLVPGEDGDVADPPVRVGGDGLQQHGQPGGERLHGGAVEQVGAELPVAAQGPGAVGVALLGDGQGQVELGEADLDRFHGDLEAGQGGLRLGRALEREQHLEQRVAGRRALRVDRLDQLLERQVLVGVGGQVGVAGAGDQFAEGRVAGGVGAQYQGVDEESDQVVQGLVGAPGDRAADRDVGARPHPGEQGGERGVQDHEQAGVAGPGEPGEPGEQLGLQVERHGPAAVGGHRRAAPVGGEFQVFGCAGQCLCPVVELAGAEAVGVVGVAEGALLPERVVGVLDRERRPLRGGAGAPGGVGGGEVAGEGGQGPAVAGHVVQQQEQHVLVGGEGEQRGTQRQFGGDVVGVAGGEGEPFGEVRLGGGLDGEHRLGLLRRQDVLVRLAVVARVEGAQALVAPYQVGEGGAQGLLVGFAVQAQGERDGVGGVRPLEAVEEPQPALGGGQRYPFGPRDGGQRGAGVPGLVEDLGEGGDGGGLEQVADGEFGAEDGPDPAGQPGGEQRVPAELEEVLVDAGLRDAEHLGEQGGEDLLAG